jgi:hypothetical protein
MYPSIGLTQGGEGRTRGTLTEAWSQVRERAHGAWNRLTRSLADDGAATPRSGRAPPLPAGGRLGRPGLRRVRGPAARVRAAGCPWHAQGGLPHRPARRVGDRHGREPPCAAPGARRAPGEPARRRPRQPGGGRAGAGPGRPGPGLLPGRRAGDRVAPGLPSRAAEDRSVDRLSATPGDMPPAREGHPEGIGRAACFLCRGPARRPGGPRRVARCARRRGPALPHQGLRGRGTVRRP